MKKLEENINYIFKDKSLLEAALTHASCLSAPVGNYERLEFLGDRVLGLLVAKMLYKRFPDEPEGSLSQRFVTLVCKETVANVARALDIPPHIKIANKEVRDSENVLCDVVEALIGAIFLDSGIAKAEKFVEANWSELIEKDLTPPKDHKTHLQELAHAKGCPAPVYSIASREGSEHEPVFTIKVEVGTAHRHQTGKGRNKKIAEQEAAKKMIAVLEAPK